MTARVVVVERPKQRLVQQLHPAKACDQLRALADVVPGPAVWFVAEGTERDDFGPLEEDGAA